MNKNTTGPDTSILECMRLIAQWSQQLLPIVDADGRLLGVVSDGDIRRAILQGKALDQAVASIMNSRPVTLLAENQDRGRALFLLREHSLRWIPLVDSQGKFVELWALEDLLQFQSRKNMVVIMAGGLGARLMPLTNDMPKPMLPVGGKPLLEHIVENFVRQGFRSFTFSVNYKKEIIEDYFGDGRRFGASIHYLHEEERLGTAGALSLLPQGLDAPCIVMNGDILTTLDFGKLMENHIQNNAVATMVVRRYRQQIPYGVISVDDDAQMVSIEEKPCFSFLISAGINVLSVSAIRYVPSAFFDMPDLYRRLLEEKQPVQTYETEEYWRDIGNLQDYRQANHDITDLFE